MSGEAAMERLNHLTGALLQPNLSTRISALSLLVEECQGKDASFVLLYLLSSHYKEKKWRLALINSCSAIISTHFSHDESQMEALLQAFRDDFLDLPSMDKAHLLLEVFRHCDTLKAICCTNDTSKASFQLYRSIILSIFEALYGLDIKSEENKAFSMFVHKVSNTSIYSILTSLDMSALTSTQLLVVSLLAAEARFDSGGFRSNLITEYGKKIMAMKAPIPSIFLFGFKRLLGSLTQEEWMNSFEQSISRMMKKAPESSSVYIASGISH